MKIFYQLIVLFTCACVVQVSGQNDYRLLLHSGTLLPAPNLENFINEKNPSTDEIVNGYYYRFIQFYTIPDGAQKELIAASGIKLLNYIPKNTFMAAIPTGIDKSKLQLLNIRSIIRQETVQKINSKLLGDVPSYAVTEQGMVDLSIQFQNNIALEQAIIFAEKIGHVLKISAINHTVDLRIASNDINKVADQPWVFYVDAISPPSTPDDTKGRSLHRSNIISSDYSTGMHYDGTGVVLGLADDGEIGPHIDFTGRVTDHVGTGPGGTHGDMTSGIVMGAGNLDPSIRGMATGAYLHVFNINGYPHILNSVNNYNTLGIVITSTSYSQGCNEYTSDSEFGDQTIHDNPQLEFVFSAGNNGTGATAGDCGYGAGLPWATITGGYKQGKNVITCGNLSPFEVLDNTSSHGPASDGRIKPDICSNGLDQMSTDQNNTYQVGGGTSAACPGMAGVCAQLYQAYKEMNGGNNPESPLIKACLLNSAEDIGNPGPDYTYGWGRVNALRALKTMQDNHYLLDSVDQGDVNTHTITIPSNVRQVRVMLYWLDPAGSPVSSQYLVNDLKLEVTDPTSITFNPWILDPTPLAANLSSTAVRGIDNLNNMEQVTIDSPATGNYTITVTGSSVPQGAQRYYIVYEFRTDEIIVTYPNGGEGFIPGQNEVIRWDGPKGVNTFSVSYSTDNGSTWSPIGTANSTTLQLNWLVPATLITGKTLIRVDNGTSSDVSDSVFTIIETPQNIQVDWACTDTIHLTWDIVPGASGYEVYQLGTKYMDPIGTSATNEFFVSGINSTNEYWFSVSALANNGQRGRRAIAINKQPGTFSCPLALDAQMIAIKPQGSLQSCQDNSAVTVFINIKNFGHNPISNFPLSYSLDGGPVVNETYSVTIAPFTTATYAFTTTINLSSIGNHTLVTWSSLTGDMNLNNDSLSSSISVIAGTNAPVPFVENFDSFATCPTAANCGTTVCAVVNGWVNEENGMIDDIDFRTYNGATPTTSTGPDADHTTGNATGKYMYLEASNCFLKTAMLTSPCFDLTTLTTPVLSFWYHMYGVDMGELHVDVYNGETWTKDVMPTITGDQGNIWKEAIISLASFSSDIINIRFRGITGSSYQSDLAIDDVNIANTVSINDHEFEGNITVYPNPSSGIFNIVMNGLKREEINLQIYDMQGKTLQQNAVQVSLNYTAAIDMHAYAKGIYFLVIKSDTGIKRFKLTVI